VVNAKGLGLSQFCTPGVGGRAVLIVHHSEHLLPVGDVEYGSDKILSVESL
jgi:hypothetical protein